MGLVRPHQFSIYFAEQPHYSVDERESLHDELIGSPQAHPHGATQLALERAYPNDGAHLREKGREEQKFCAHGNFRFASVSDFSAVITNTSDNDVLGHLARSGVPTPRAA